MTIRYKIHPAIGIARCGDSPDYYLAPNTVNGLPRDPQTGSSVQKFRDDQQRMLRQAAEFQVYAYDDSKPDEPAKPVSLASGAVKRIDWTVYVANKKAIWYTFEQLQGEGGYADDHPRRNLQWTTQSEREAQMIDPGPRTLSGPDQKVEFSKAGAGSYPATFPAKAQPYTVETLGEAVTTGDSRLLVLAGFGHSGSLVDPKITTYANNDNWHDDISDGPVLAELTLEDGSTVQAEGAWVLSVPPSYAPQIPNVITLYDVMNDTAIREMNAQPDIFRNGQWNPEYFPNFQRDIAPIFNRAALSKWVAVATGDEKPNQYVGIPPYAHLFDMEALADPSEANRALRENYLGYFRLENNVDSFEGPNGTAGMPLLAGDNPISDTKTSRYLVLTQTQLFMLNQWAAGMFKNEAPAPEGAGDRLDRAALENCVGGAFCPGIEMTWIARNPEMFSAPFRIRQKPIHAPPLSMDEDMGEGMEPGDLTKRMAIPWQADFNECSDQNIPDSKNLVLWWPAQRPMTVYDGIEPVAWARGIVPNGSGPTNPGDLQMVSVWKELGFVKNIGSDDQPQYVEVERNPLKNS